jgi:transcriptional antiterminator RfaH
MTAGSAKWYVAHTHAHAEAKALNLRRHGYAVFFPRYRKRRRHARRIEIVSAPLFPRYVFVLVDRATQRWRAIGSTFGVAHLVWHGDEPAVVPDKVIA